LVTNPFGKAAEGDSDSYKGSGCKLNLKALGESRADPHGGHHTEPEAQQHGLQ
jgi:hypothetical protein